MTTNPDISEQIVAAEAEVERLEAEVGDAVLDGEGADQVEALRQAREHVEALTLAAGAAEKRKALRSEQDQRDTERAERRSYYESVVAWLPLVGKVMEARKALADAEHELLAAPPHRLVKRFAIGVIPRPSDAVAHGIDKRLAHRLPQPPTVDRPVEDVAPDRIAELIARAKELARAEATGKPPRRPRQEW